MNTVASCVQTPSTMCISVPSSNLRSIHVDYKGRGTQGNDVLIVGLVFGGIVLAILLFALAARWA